MILVVGSTGMVGSEICRLLGEKGLPFRALVRDASDPAKVERLRGFGAEIVKGDLRDRASLMAACQNVSKVICTASAMPFSYQPGVNDIQIVDSDGVMTLVDACRASGVQHLIHTTFSGNINLDFPLRNAKRAVEAGIQTSGLTYTILRPSYFMEVWLSPAVGFDPANGKATVYGLGDQPIAWITLKDVAAYAVESLTNPEARNCTLDLGGPENLSLHQVIAMFEKAFGKTIEVTHVPVEALQAQLAGAGDPMQKSFLGLMLCTAAGDRIDMRGVQQAFTTQPTPLSQFIAGLGGK